MVAIIPEDRESQIVSRALSELRSKTDITQYSPGAKARSLLEVVSREISSAYTYFDKELLKAFVKYATGSDLDMIGDLVGVRRYQATRAEASSTTQIQKFYVRGNLTFGAINGSESFIIPAGTQVATPKVGDTEQVIYRITEDVTCNSASTEAYASIESNDFGTDANVGAGSLSVHNFELYDDYSNGTLLTTNVESILYGRDDETDDNLRYRIMNHALSSESGNATAIRLASLSIPGVADILLDEFSQGIGTASVYVESVVVPPSLSLLQAVQTAIGQVKSMGNLIIARSPSFVGIEIAITVNLYKTLPSGQDEDLRIRIRDAIYRYINALGMSKTLYQAELVRVVLDVDKNIKSIGTMQKPIDEIYVWKYSKVEDSRRPQALLGDYAPRYSERLVVEFGEVAGANPIRIRTRKDGTQIVR